MARALVIGGTLFIGRALVERLLERGDEVTIMHRGSKTPFGDRVREIRCDRNDIPAVEAALSNTSFDVVYDNVYDWQRGTIADQVMAAARSAGADLRRYVFTSSVAVYGHGGPCDEDCPLVPASYPNPYSVHKAESERALFTAHRAEGLPVSTLRPAFIYGPNNPFDREAFFWDRVLADRPIIIPGDGSSTMQWVHVDDVVRAATLASERDVANGRAYNLASWPPISQIDFVHLLARIAGGEPQLVKVPREKIHAAGGQLAAPPFYFGAYLDLPPLTVTVDRVRTELQLELRDLEQGMRDTFDWYREQKRPQPDFSWEDQLLAAPGKKPSTN